MDGLQTDLNEFDTNIQPIYRFSASGNEYTFSVKKVEVGYFPDGDGNQKKAIYALCRSNHPSFPNYVIMPFSLFYDEFIPWTIIYEENDNICQFNIGNIYDNYNDLVYFTTNGKMEVANININNWKAIDLPDKFSEGGEIEFARVNRDIYFDIIISNTAKGLIYIYYQRHEEGKMNYFIDSPDLTITYGGKLKGLCSAFSYTPPYYGLDDLLIGDYTNKKVGIIQFSTMTSKYFTVDIGDDTAATRFHWTTGQFYTQTKSGEYVMANGDESLKNAINYYLSTHTDKSDFDGDEDTYFTIPFHISAEDIGKVHVELGVKYLPGYKYATDYSNPDTDSDGVSDGTEATELLNYYWDRKNSDINPQINEIEWDTSTPPKVKASSFTKVIIETHEIIQFPIYMGLDITLESNSIDNIRIIFSKGENVIFDTDKSQYIKDYRLQNRFYIHYDFSNCYNIFPLDFYSTCSWTLKFTDIKRDGDYGKVLTTRIIIKGYMDATTTDSDSDGMTDGWEWQYIKNDQWKIDNKIMPIVEDRTQNPDDDGFCNYLEYQSGLNPRKDNRVFALIVSMEENNNVVTFSNDGDFFFSTLLDLIPNSRMKYYRYDNNNDGLAPKLRDKGIQLNKLQNIRNGITSWLKNQLSTTGDDIIIMFFSTHGGGNLGTEYNIIDQGGREDSNGDEGSEHADSNEDMHSVDEVIYTNKWDGDTVIRTKPYDEYWDDTLAEDLNTLRDEQQQPLYTRLIFIRQGCFGGGIIDDISATNRVILTATSETLLSYSYYQTEAFPFYSAWSVGFTSALNKRDPNLNPVDADSSDFGEDGFISMREAFYYGRDHDAYYTTSSPTDYERPWLDDNGDHLPTFKNKQELFYDPNNPNGYDPEGELAARTFLPNVPKLVG